MTPFLTKLDGVPDVADAVPGMAYFAGTGPAGKTCGDCKHRGYSRKSQFAGKDGHFRTRKVSGCAMFKKLTGRHGPQISDDNRACKYFEVKPRDD